MPVAGLGAVLPSFYAGVRSGFGEDLGGTSGADEAFANIGRERGFIEGCYFLALGQSSSSGTGGLTYFE